MKNIRLIASDMDGTLLKDGWRISKTNVEAIKQAEAMGITFIAATGRDYFEASGPLKEAGLSIPMVCVNGADVRNPDGSCIHRRSIDDSLLSSIQAVLEKERIYYELYTSEGAFTNNKAEGLDLVVDLLLSSGDFSSEKDAKELAQMRFDAGTIRVVDSYSDLPGDRDPDVLKLLAFSNDEAKRERIKKELAFLDVAVSASAKENLEITHRDATKGHGVLKMAKRLNIKPHEIMAIGDNLNDLSMFDVAGTAVAMANAGETVKQVSDILTRRNDEDGVAYVVDQVLTARSDV
ncbi:Cof-type HAD-IIB family hydrolase [Salisediminibacterium selenitireducens]|uniref:Cof-like hydrolase n=1 Tax=Bacillus selenitireducens (strain ATCC 700615 / DSM 15326 / MLS10) TaxID=439292 RepID=D6XVH3_BACIE|nr:Cof-type HAD-IIB family hydrolase [Salisediminibacterium selenitireducens]ADH99711.1 Cof-like hydrolase [[Bacillus] selenitireducens MLS10]